MTETSVRSLAVLADLVVRPPKGILRTAAREVAGMALTDLVGVTIAGIPETVSRVVLALVEAARVEGRGVQVAGSAARVSSLDAAFANAAIGHALDFDDSSFILGGHPSVVIYPALLALAEDRSLPPSDVVSSYLVGLEALSRIAAAVNFHLYEKGWHPTATLGVFGAAAGAAHLLRLDCQQVMHALGLAATMAGGFKASFGTMAKPLQVGNASRSGLMAALLAESGATASADALDAKNGFFTVFNGAGNYDASALARPSGDGLPALKFKLYPSCGATHVVIDAARALRSEYSLDPGRIASVAVLINPRRLPHVNRPVVTEPLAGKFSVQYTAAAALVDGNVGIEHFTPAAFAREDIRQVAGRVSAGPLEGEVNGLKQPCVMRITLVDGTCYEISLEGPTGREPADYPEKMEAKFLACATRVQLPGDAKRVYELSRNFEKLTAVNDLMGELAAAGSKPRVSS